MMHAISKFRNECLLCKLCLNYLLYVNMRYDMVCMFYTLYTV